MSALRTWQLDVGVTGQVRTLRRASISLPEDSRFITEIDDMLTLDGLLILFERNRAPRPRSRAH